MKTLRERDEGLLKTFKKLYGKCSKHPELPDKIILPLNYAKKDKRPKSNQASCLEWFKK